MLHVRVVGIASALSMGATAHAQINAPLRQPASIPIELATALLASGGLAGSGDPQVLVGELPEWFASKLKLPKGAEVLGSAFVGSTVVGVVTYPSASDSVVRFLERDLLAAGWKGPPPPFSYGGGFRTAASARGVRSPATLCADKTSLYVSMLKQRSASSTMLLRYSAQAVPGTVCNPGSMPPGAPRSQFPTLFNPPGGSGAEMISCYDNSSSGSAGTQTRLRTPMLPDAIIDHYAKQLADSGWVPELSLAVPTAARSWTTRDSAGPARLTLSVGAMSKDTLCRQVDMQVFHQQRNP